MNEQGGAEMNVPQTGNEQAELALITDKVAEIKQRCDQLPKSRPRRLTIPAIFWRAGDEDFISDYLAYILDPERNGIGNQPLEVLLTLAYGEEAEFELEQVNIQREYTFDDPSRGRIDFMIRLGKEGESGVIGIENKIYSPESDNQTTAYAQGMKEDFEGKKHFLILLTPDGRSPASREFKPVSYMRLVEELRAIRYPLLNDIHKSVIWEDFLAHLEEYIVMDKGKLELSPRARLYLENHETLEELKRAYLVDAGKVFDFVTAGIRNYLGAGWLIDFQRRNSQQYYYRESWKMGKVFSFYQYNFSQDNLLVREKIPYFLGVYCVNYGKRDHFFNWFRDAYPQIPGLCSERGIEAYPTTGEGADTNRLIARKEILPVKNDFVALAHQLVQVAEDFSVFTPMMEEAVQTYKKLNGLG
jgi:hypothetical protein